MVVNDDACNQEERGALESIAGKPAPTEIALSVFPGAAGRTFFVYKIYMHMKQSNQCDVTVATPHRSETCAC